MPRTILVVDDDRPIADVLADLLCDEGYDVRTAYDGQAALREFEREPVDLILSDVSMPRLDGPALIRQLRARGRAVPVILMSAVYQDVDLPGVEFVPKPFDVGQVADLVARVVEQNGALHR
ncbi:MAG TPA: response regulator [Thermomicrobiales bacterium]|jgi:DNA-binding response OmpR family regulator